MDNRKLYELHAQLCEAFTSPKRLEILNLLQDKELSVMEFIKLTGMRQSNISQHLSILREKGIVKTRREGTAVYYSLSNPKIIKAFNIMKEILKESIEEKDKITSKW
ncbi:MAG: metalloregulator ArsR/SmtB family transcription factor [Candidatus Omnitrophica bacterium]|nr:metalloregulator ArsR/SmtB family transcription factor [Candidatus Omnitrophota bacterium]